MTAFSIESINDDLILRNKYGIYSKKELEIQLKKGHLTIVEIGKIYDLKKYQIEHIFNSLGITFRNSVNDTRVLNSSIDSSTHQVLLGTLLGDGYMTDPKYYRLSHGVFQMDYCYHVAERLCRFISSFGDKNTGGTTEKSFEFWTHRHNVFIPYFQRFYSHGAQKKFFTIDSAPDLEPEGLAYWYMDDGKYNKYGLYLCVGDISEEEGNVLRDLLKTKFNIETTFQIHNSEHDYHTIYIKAESRSHFLGLVSPYIISSMYYKLTGESFPQIKFSKDIIIKKHLELCEKAGRFIHYFGDFEIQNKLQFENKIEDPKSLYIKSILEAIKNKNQISYTNLRSQPSEQKLKDLLDQGLTDGQIGNKLGFGRNSISQLRRFLKIDRKKCRIIPEQDIKLKQLFSQPNMTIQKAMLEMKMSFYKIKTWKQISKDFTL